MKDVPANATVVGVPGRVVVQDGEKVRRDLDHHKLPDPIIDRCNALQSEIDMLKGELAKLKEGSSK